MLVLLSLDDVNQTGAAISIHYNIQYTKEGTADVVETIAIGVAF